MSTTRKSIVHSLAPLALTAACGLLSTVPAAAQQYSITGLGVLPTGVFSYANGLNAQGQVAGTSNVGGYNGTQQATLYRGGALSSVEPGYSQGHAINSLGQLVGLREVPNPDGPATLTKAFVYDEHTGVTTDLPTLGGQFSDAFGINNAGQIVGESATATQSQHAFLYDSATGTLTDLDPLIGGYDSTVANGISDSGLVTGGVFNNYAFLYDSQNGTVSFLPSLVNSDPTGAPGIVGSGVNDLGQVTGYSTSATNGNSHAFLYSSSNGTIIDLTPALPANAQSYGQGINALGDVVGAITGASATTAFLSHAGQLIDLNTRIAPSAGWQLEYAQAINNRGQIVGYGFHDGVTQGFLLTPNAAPEPSQFAALGVGLLGLGGLAFKARRRAA